jgi:hypothetical protein
MPDIRANNGAKMRLLNPLSSRFKPHGYATRLLFEW